MQHANVQCLMGMLHAACCMQDADVDVDYDSGSGSVLGYGCMDDAYRQQPAVSSRQQARSEQPQEGAKC